MGINLVAVLWGLAEATLFFIVPDVWLSIVGRKKLRTGLLACLYSLLGALLGGVILYLWGLNNLASASKVIEKVPAVSHGMLVQAHAELSEKGLLAVLLGPLSGTPYKLYAIQAADTEIALWAFILISIPARLMRFILVTVICHYAIKVISKLNFNVDPLIILIAGWILFYACYFYLTGTV